MGVDVPMARRIGVVLGGLLIAAVLVPGSVAKGPLKATIEGPGLETPIVFGGWSESGATEEGRFPLMPLVESSNFFPAAFGSYNARPVARVARPKSDLGPRYIVTYDLGGSEGATSLIVQDVYPYANPNAVTYMAPGQPFYDSMETFGGWFAAPAAARPLKDVLVEAGLPRSPPTGSDGSPFPWTVAGAALAMGALLAFGAAAVVLIRRRPGPATT
jgi:hypothetical protein